MYDDKLMESKHITDTKDIGNETQTRFFRGILKYAYIFNFIYFFYFKFIVTLGSLTSVNDV
jgi:hypothetical protein